MSQPLSSRDSNRQPQGPVSDLTLERYHLGELPAAEAEALRDRLSADASLRDRLRRIEEHEQSFAKSHPADRWVGLIREKAARNAVESPARSVPARPAREKPRAEGESFWSRLLFPGNLGWAAGLAVLLLVTWVAAPRWMQGDADGSDGIRLKGKSAELKLYLQTEGGPRLLSPGSTVKAGDALQIEFHPGGYRFAAIVSVDGRGSVTWHWPTGPQGNSDVTLLPSHRLPQAFQLDSAPAFERFYLLLSQDSLSLGEYQAPLSASIGQDAEAWIAQERRENPNLHIQAFPLLKAP